MLIIYSSYKQCVMALLPVCVRFIFAAYNFLFLPFDGRNSINNIILQNQTAYEA